MDNAIGLIEQRGLRTRAIAGTLTDEQLFAWFAQDRTDKANTRASYLSQLSRLAWYCRHQLGLSSVTELQREDFDGLKNYLSNPPAHHRMTASVGRDHPNWRPFRSALQPSSVALALTIIRTFYAWAAADDICAIPQNPLSSKKVRRQRLSNSAKTITRHLTPKSLAYINQAIDDMAALGAEQQERARWIIYLATHTGLRASEISRATAGMITPSRVSGCWSLNITRKGNLESSIPLLPDLMQRWAHYKSICNIPASPNTPLVCALHPGRQHKALSRKTIWEIAKGVFHAAASQAAANADEVENMRLQAASTHWLRHTFGTTLMDSGADIRSTRDLMDHADIATTSRYTHIGETQRIEDLKKLEKALKHN